MDNRNNELTPKDKVVITIVGLMFLVILSVFDSVADGFDSAIAYGALVSIISVALGSAIVDKIRGK